MTWYHPSYYKKLRDLRRQASGNGRVGPRVTSLKKNKTLDRSGDMGYSGIRTAAIHGGHSSARPVQPKAAVIGNGNGPTGVSSMRALRDPGGNCIVKMSRGDVTWSCQGYGFLFPKNSRLLTQASSPKQQASSLKPQASSSKILEPRKSFTDPEPRCWTMINVLCECLI